jgi:hypothetical protein
MLKRSQQRARRGSAPTTATAWHRWRRKLPQGGADCRSPFCHDVPALPRQHRGWTKCLRRRHNPSPLDGRPLSWMAHAVVAAGRVSTQRERGIGPSPLTPPRSSRRVHAVSCMSTPHLLGETRHGPATDWLPSGRLKGALCFSRRLNVQSDRAQGRTPPRGGATHLQQGCTPVKARRLICQAA